MSDNLEKIPFSIEISRIIEVLASQIYPSPLALLRENTQNSYDAILLRKHAGQQFNPLIEITISASQIKVSDNGIGMTKEDLRNHYWRAGSSSKNNPEAKSAGVVGTFGIGAMANFGIAEELTVTTESALSGARTRSEAKRSTLSATENCIPFINEESTGSPGTTVTAFILPEKALSVEQAITYISEFVSFLPIRVLVNGQLASQKDLAAAVSELPQVWQFTEEKKEIGGGFKADVNISGAASGEVRIALSKLYQGDKFLDGRLILRQGVGTLRTFRSGFGLANTSVHSAYQFGGIADFLFLQPTAGREALTTESIQLLQTIMPRIDELVSRKLAEYPESGNNTNFMTWVIQHAQYQLLTHLKVQLEPGTATQLSEISIRSKENPYLIYGGNDPSTISHASEDRPLIILTRSNPRRQCEHEYLKRFCSIEEISDNPVVQKTKSRDQWSMPESALSYRLSSILASDYFLSSNFSFGKISHGLPILVTKQSEPVEICLDPDGTTTKLLLTLYKTNFSAFDGMVKDFVRNIVFPRVSDLVPSSTRQGAEAFLKTLQRNREFFEYESADSDSIYSVWQDYNDGKLTQEEAAAKSSTIAAQSFQVIDSSAAASVRDVVPDIIDNEAALQQDESPGEDTQKFEALPPILRTQTLTHLKLLTIPDDESDLKGFRCFIAISERVREASGDFFLQPHRTSVVWGGQKVLFIFEHHSGKFGLYYDVQTQELVNEVSGGRSFQTCTIVLKNKIFIPVPPELQASFLPRGIEKKRLEIRSEILYIE
ncbi:ATP-binding protein [Glaciimonas sp. CA11.2]|uniref:ATP-binding protein n=2 Tax=Glaciimonas sp. CA11.2 TaxID=3048601 RepID=UPI002AB42F93|nr:ATP-binding protein [Glaciimonas sp. CA11.2]MDY7545487.1 ATP-binding protein [Glaciimonas sp. CA11.2]